MLQLQHAASHVYVTTFTVTRNEGQRHKPQNVQFPDTYPSCQTVHKDLITNVKSIHSLSFCVDFIDGACTYYY